MKSLFTMACLTLTLVLANNAEASRPPLPNTCNMNSCASTITLDSGTGKNCTRTSDSCQCAKLSTECYTAQRMSTCSGSWGWSINNGTMIGTTGGTICCGYKKQPGTSICPPLAETGVTEEQFENIVNAEVTGGDVSAGLGDVFDYNMGDRATEYYGWKDTEIRSPNFGRTTSVKARLDACLYFSDVDWIETNGGSNQSEKHATCVGASYGCGASTKNDYCTNTGYNDGVPSVYAAVCKDRCDCLYNQGTCESL